MLLQALEIMEKLILPGSDKMDVRDPEAVSGCSQIYRTIQLCASATLADDMMKRNFPALCRWQSG